MIEKFAGVLSEALFCKDRYGVAPEDITSHTDWLIESDGSGVSRVAEMISKPGRPPHQIIETARRWAMEMLCLPEVESYIHELSNSLLQVGCLSGHALLPFLEHDLWGLWLKKPKWRRRFRGGL